MRAPAGDARRPGDAGERVPAVRGDGHLDDGSTDRHGGIFVSLLVPMRSTVPALRLATARVAPSGLGRSFLASGITPACARGAADGYGRRVADGWDHPRVRGERMSR